jgi:hypothetical protein
MKITIDTIMDFNPCYSYDEIREMIERNIGKKRKTININDVLESDIKSEDKLWLILRKEFMTEKQLLSVEIFCWDKIARKIWEKYYPDDKRPHKFVALKKKKLKGIIIDKKQWKAASDAAWAATLGAATCAAESAAARAAESAAAWAAESDAARDTASAIAWAASMVATCDKILKYISQILTTKE